MDKKKESCAELALLSRQIGERLSHLRRQAGPTQQQAAEAMGLRGRAGQSYLSQIERGYFPSCPPLGRVLACLQVYGCGLDVLCDILDRYTSLPPRLEQQSQQAIYKAIEVLPERQQHRAYNYAVGLKTKACVPVRTRADAALRKKCVLAWADSAMMQKRLRDLFKTELEKMGVGWFDVLGYNLRFYGRVVFATMWRLRRARPAWRAKALKRLEDWPVQYDLDPAPFLAMKAAVIRFIEELEQTG